MTLAGAGALLTLKSPPAAPSTLIFHLKFDTFATKSDDTEDSLEINNIMGSETYLFATQSLALEIVVFFKFVTSERCFPFWF